MATQGAFQVLAHRAAALEDQRLDRSRRELEHLGDLGVRAALELAHDQRRPLVEGQAREPATDLGGRGRRLVRYRTSGEVVIDVDSPSSGRADALATDAVG